MDKNNDDHDYDVCSILPTRQDDGQAKTMSRVSTQKTTKTSQLRQKMQSNAHKTDDKENPN